MKKAFTLIEIMIIVSIIGILVAIATPLIIRARNSAQREACQNNQLKYDSAIMNYILDNDVRNLSQTPFTGLTTDDPIVRNALIGSDGYLKADGHCPANGVYTFLDEEGRLGESIECSLAVDPILVHVFPGHELD